MNEGSSRSHSLFIMTVTLTNSKDLSVTFCFDFIFDPPYRQKVGNYLL